MGDVEVVDKPVETEEKPEEKKEHLVPVGVLLEERRERQALQLHVDALNDKLEEALKTVEKKVDAVPASEEERTAQYWAERLGVNAIKQELADLKKTGADLKTLKDQQAALQAMAQSQFEEHVEDMVDVAKSAYDAKTMNVKADEWEQLVADLMTPELVVKIGRGSKRAQKELIDRAKKLVTIPGAMTRAREAAHVRGLPKAPGPGGTALPPGQEPKPFTSLRDLHKDAAQVFQDIVNRDK